jgi:polyisoprenoid-binding protein YceI
MTLVPGTHTVGPDSCSLRVHTYREGMAQKVGHDLIIHVEQWQATVAVDEHGAPVSIELSADPRSLQVLEGHHGVKPLTDKDRAEIRSNIDAKVLGGQAITFKSSAIEVAGGRLVARGELTIAGNSRPTSFELELGSDGRVSGTLPITQSEWGIKPYRALMGALKVRDAVDVVLEVSLPATP